MKMFDPLFKILIHTTIPWRLITANVDVCWDDDNDNKYLK